MKACHCGGCCKCLSERSPMYSTSSFPLLCPARGAQPILRFALALLLLTTCWEGMCAQGQSFAVVSLRATPVNHGFTSISPLTSRLFVARNTPLAVLVELAFGFDAISISGQPSWLTSDLYDLQASWDDEHTPSEAATKNALRTVLTKRFDLRTHVAIKQTSGYALRVDNGGLKCKPTQAPEGPISICRRGTKPQHEPT